MGSDEGPRRPSAQARFQDKVCLVTGAGWGIGKAAAKRFACEGGKVIIADLNEEHGNQAVQEIVKTGGEAIFVKTNVGESHDVQAAIDAGVKRWGRIDIV